MLYSNLQTGLGTYARYVHDLLSEGDHFSAQIFQLASYKRVCCL